MLCLNRCQIVKLATLVLNLLISPVMAHEEHGSVTTAAHVHGEARLNMVISDGMVLAEFHSPLDNLLGFEHKPETAKQRQRFQAMLAALQTPDAVFILRGSDCELASLKITDPFTQGSAHSHNALTAEYTLNCTDRKTISGLQTELFSHYPRLKKISVQLIRDQGQSAFTLTVDHAAQQW